MTIFTIGYEGRSLEEFIDRLVAHGVALLADVRELPLSRKAGFSKNGLAAALGERGIGYIHMRDLGTPRAMRHQLREDGDYESFFAAYAGHLGEHKDAVGDLTDVAGQKSVCLMCFEDDYRQCHRSVLAEKLKTLGFTIEHL